MVALEAYVPEKIVLLDRVTSLTNDYGSKNLELQTTSVLVTDAALLRQCSAGSQKEIERCIAKLASWKKLEDEIPVTKEKVAKLMTFVT